MNLLFWMQLINSIPVSWKINIMEVKGNPVSLCIFNCHLIKSQIYVINRLNSKELYSVQSYCGNITDVFWIFFQNNLRLTRNIFDALKGNCHNDLYLNKFFFFLKKKVTRPPFSLCKSKDETTIHCFFDCLVTQNLWKQLR